MKRTGLERNLTMKNQSELFPWDDLKQFIERVEEEKQPVGEAKPYIDQIKQILLSHRADHSAGIE
ncbi:hypothetical protein [Guptibacillus spartinae]|uniref:hypothetical protein n=1 Tax=Guptibacillus spartinae TaxID=3025679 RepID=UPI002362A99D|nr:hypothetical protein [Pseudalkalibacillus spartinae]